MTDHDSHKGVSGLPKLDQFDFHQRLVPRLDVDALALLERTQQFLLDHSLLLQPVPLDAWAVPEFLNNSLQRQSTRKTA